MPGWSLLAKSVSLRVGVSSGGGRKRHLPVRQLPRTAQSTE